MTTKRHFHRPLLSFLGAAGIALGVWLTGCGPNGSDGGFPCSAEMYLTDLSEDGVCLAWSECAPGSYEQAPGDMLYDRSCEPCPSDTFSLTANQPACAAMNPCALNERVVEAATPSNDWVCEACPQGMFVSSTDSSQCEVPTVCPAGTWTSVPAGPGSAPVCDLCMAGEYCAGGDSSPVECGDVGDDWDDDSDAATPCVGSSVCSAGSFVTTEPTSTTDRECMPCPNGTFSEDDNTAECTEWSDCDDGLVVITPGTDEADTVCGAAPGWVREFGLARGDFNTDLALEPSGNILVVGSSDIGQSGFGDTDAFLRRFSPTGEALGHVYVSSGYLTDAINAVVVDGEGNIYVAGYTEGELGAVADSDGDAFVQKYDASLTLVWTLQFGTTVTDGITDIAVAADGSLFVVGNTGGTLPSNTSLGNVDVFVGHVSSAGAVDWLRQFGSAGLDQSTGLAIDSEGALYVTGSVRMALPGQMFAGGYQDAFLVKLTSSGTDVWTHMVGTTETDVIKAVGVDADDQVTIAGEVVLPLVGEPVFGMYDGFVRRVSDTGVAVWTERFGSPDTNIVYAMHVTPNGDVFVVGSTDDALPGQTYQGGLRDGFITAYEADGTPLWVRHIGTDGHDFALGVAVAADGSIFVSGETTGTFPGQSRNGVKDAFLTRFVL